MTHLMDVCPLRAGEFDQTQLKWHFEKKNMYVKLKWLVLDKKRFYPNINKYMYQYEIDCI